jgi:hypothetical protein
MIWGRRAASKSSSKRGGIKTAAIADPERINRVALFRSSARSATRNPGAAAIDCMSVAETSERSVSTTTTLSPRTTALLNVQGQHRKGDQWNDDRKQIAGPVAPKKPDLAQRNQR